MNGKAQQDARYLAAARMYGAIIERLARGYEADPELRRDLVQEIHAALWRSFSIYRPIGGAATHRIYRTHSTNRKRRCGGALKRP